MAVLESVKRMSKTKVGSMREVAFTYYAPTAKKVCLAGKFNDWNTTALLMKKDKDGTWRTTVRLAPGTYEYKYFVDGAWAQDIPGADRVPNSFGTYNGVIGVR